MAYTPFKVLKSEDILSGHINGLHNSIKNIETALNLKTVSARGIRLDPVLDMEDVINRYRIYEARTRGWLSDPVPIIFRNGERVDSSEYEVHAGYGLIVFITQQDPEDRITADVSYVTSDSSKLAEIEELARLEPEIPEYPTAPEVDLTEVNNEISALKTSVSEVEQGISRLQRRNVVKIDNSTALMYNRQRGINFSDITYSPSVLVAGNAMDLFPVLVDHPVEAEAVLAYAGATNWAQSNSSIGCIYTSKNGIPHELVAQSEPFVAGGAGTTFEPALTRGKGGVALTERAYLDVGLYFVGMYHSYGIAHYAVQATRELAEDILIEIETPTNATYRDASGSDFYTGFRVKHGNGVNLDVVDTLPDYLPEKMSSTFRALARNMIMEIYISAYTGG